MRAALLALLLAAAGCGDLTVDPGPAAGAGSPGAPGPSVALSEVRDRRDGGAAAPLGEVITGFGFRQATLRPALPATQMVAEAVGAGLAARGRLPPAGAAAELELTVDLMKLSAGRDGALTASADLLVELRDRRSGERVWLDRERRALIEAGYVSLDLGPGVIAPATTLAPLLRRAIDGAVDGVLERRGFPPRALLTGG
jgi:hypothetical protein